MNNTHFFLGINLDQFLQRSSAFFLTMEILHTWSAKKVCPKYIVVFCLCHFCWHADIMDFLQKIWCYSGQFSKGWGVIPSPPIPHLLQIPPPTLI